MMEREVFAPDRSAQRGSERHPVVIRKKTGARLIAMRKSSLVLIVSVSYIAVANVRKRKCLVRQRRQKTLKTGAVRLVPGPSVG